MNNTLLIAFALILVLEGVVPFIAPNMWRDTFRRLIQFSDGADSVCRSGSDVDRNYSVNDGFHNDVTLPEYIADALPHEANKIEHLREERSSTCSVFTATST